MFFRNLTFFRFPLSLSLNELAFGLSECALKPVGPMELSSRGFVSPYGADNPELVARSGRCLWVTVGGEDRLLPGPVVNDQVARKLAEIERTEGRKPGGRTRKRIRDEVLMDLLPRAFVRPSRIDALIDLDTGVIAVNTSSRRAGESVVSEIRRALGSFPALPLNAEVAPRSVLTGWLEGDMTQRMAGQALDDLGLVVGDECELRDPVDHGAVVKCQRQELYGMEVAKHLEAGKQVTRLELNLNDRVSFVLGEDLVVRKLRLLDAAVDDLQSEDHDDWRAELDARFALLAGEVRLIFSVMEQAFSISKAEG